MGKSPDLGTYQPSCALAHGLVNKLSIIVGCCDILQDEVEPGSQSEKKLLLIRKAAGEMAGLLNHHQCDLEMLLSREGARKPPLFGSNPDLQVSKVSG